MGNQQRERGGLASCCLVPNQMNWDFWTLKLSGFEDIQPARAFIACCMVRAAPLLQGVDNTNCLKTAKLNVVSNLVNEESEYFYIDLSCSHLYVYCCCYCFWMRWHMSTIRPVHRVLNPYSVLFFVIYLLYFVAGVQAPSWYNQIVLLGKAGSMQVPCGLCIVGSIILGMLEI